jgi:tyrocidine synthetase-3
LNLALPSYMVPSEVVRVEELPLTLNGKVDRRKLEQLEGNGPTAENGKAASVPDSGSPFLDGVVGLAAGLLKVGETDVDVRGNFFDMRGSSLLLVRLIMLVEKKYGVKLPMRKVFAAPTIWEISEIVRQTQTPS